MSVLKPGTRCVIIAGCPENIGLIVEVIEHLGPCDGRDDAYYIRTISSRPFHQLWSGKDLIRGYSDKCVTDRHKLRPLVDPDSDETDEETIEVPSGKVTAGR
jgi:hypothetical protein